MADIPAVSNLSSFTKDKDFDTFFTLVTLNADDCEPSCRDPAKFVEHINAKFNGQSDKGDARLLMVAATMGQADMILVWQAKTTPAKKEFMGNVLSGYHCQTNTMTALWSQVRAISQSQAT